MRLFCLSYAGGTTALFRRWCAALPDGIEVCPLELPGHGSRFAEAPCRDMESVVTAVASGIRVDDGAAYAICGHSMGALIGFELARLLATRDASEPRVLYVSGRRAPHVIHPSMSWYARPSGEFVSAFKQVTGSRKHLLDNPKIFAAVDGVLRADCEIVQTYRFRRGRQLGCPIVAFGGLDDRACGRASLERWAAHTTADLRVQMLPGDHFFIDLHRKEFLDVLAADLRERLKALSQR